MTEETILRLTDSFFARMRLPEEMRSDRDERDSMKDHILSGKRELDLIACGKSVDYEADETGKDLLYNYCFYARSDCTEKFFPAYRGRLINFRHMAIAGKLITEEEGEEDAQA